MKDSYLGSAGGAAGAFSNLQIYFLRRADSICTRTCLVQLAVSPQKLDDRNTGCSELQPVKFAHSRKQDELAWGRSFQSGEIK